MELFRELQRLEVLLGLALFIAGTFVLWLAWRGRRTPFPLGVVMPF